ncbi:magnesium transporter [Bacillus mycoides]|uniref:Magnesium transporter n=2 Tax=Bacillus cereus group TaxID=86661 RepID=A0ABV3ID04_9BACI|nr:MULTISPECIES: cation-transporting P-type ATPase [Bacillus]GLV63916.1 magnesium transporter [Bacillus mycoides]MBJ8103267.1 magnesium transporter [Bacillus cereus group sp. N8]MED1509861.1 cation-transporting P-type ATPase [Bacillus proteolyticus]OJD72068.1 magnesium transporter [Bacillus sp. NH11B]PDY81077.1 magnesium transporter [Bacillus cereus]
MLYANKTVGNTSYKLSKKSIKEQIMLQKNKDLLIEIATRDVKSVFAYFKTTRDGLSVKEAQKRIQVYGRNELISKRARIAEVMIKLSEMIPGLSKQNARDELQCETVTVSRVEASSLTGLNNELKMMKLPVQELVPGDMIFLSEGDTVPADVRIIYANDLLVNESMLTGNDASIEKFESCYHLERKRFIPLKRMKDYNPLELENVCFKGTYIVGGTAKAVVVSTGKNTYSGILHTCCGRTS